MRKSLDCIKWNVGDLDRSKVLCSPKKDLRGRKWAVKLIPKDDGKHKLVLILCQSVDEATVELK